MTAGCLVSIVVPCYNVEKFVKRCIYSLLHQTYRNIEILAVNDCSTDNTFDVLRDLSYEDERLFIYFLNENSGLGKVRDYGIGVARGEYIMFVDADDWLDEETVGTCVHLIEENNADMVEFGFERKCEFEKEQKREELRYQTIFTPVNIEQKSDHISCNKLYRLDIIKKNNLQFIYRRFEDTHFTRKYALQCSKAVFIENKFYKYFVNPDSITSTLKMEVLEDFSRTDEVINIYLDRGMNERALEYEKLSRDFILRQLVSISRIPHNKFIPKPSDSKFGYYFAPWVRLFNTSGVRFRIRVYWTLGFKYTIKNILKSRFIINAI